MPFEVGIRIKLLSIHHHKNTIENSCILQMKTKKVLRLKPMEKSLYGGNGKTIEKMAHSCLGYVLRRDCQRDFELEEWDKNMSKIESGWHQKR